MHRGIALWLVVCCSFVPTFASKAASRRLPAFEATISTLDRATRELMTGSSWHAGCPVSLRDLRLLRLTYYGFDGRAHRGKLVVHRWYAEGLVHVFRPMSPLAAGN